MVSAPYFCIGIALSIARADGSVKVIQDKCFMSLFWSQNKTLARLLKKTLDTFAF